MVWLFYARFFCKSQHVMNYGYYHIIQLNLLYFLWIIENHILHSSKWFIVYATDTSSVISCKCILDIFEFEFSSFNSPIARFLSLEWGLAISTLSVTLWTENRDDDFLFLILSCCISSGSSWNTFGSFSCKSKPFDWHLATSLYWKHSLESFVCDGTYSVVLVSCLIAETVGSGSWYSASPSSWASLL